MSFALQSLSGPSKTSEQSKGRKGGGVWGLGGLDKKGEKEQINDS